MIKIPDPTGYCKGRDEAMSGGKTPWRREQWC